MHRYTAGRSYDVSVAKQCVNVVNLLRPIRGTRTPQGWSGSGLMLCPNQSTS